MSIQVTFWAIVTIDDILFMLIFHHGMPFIFLLPKLKIHTEGNKVSFVYVVILKIQIFFLTPLLLHHTFSLFSFTSFPCIPASSTPNPCNKVTQLNYMLSHLIALFFLQINLMVKINFKSHPCAIKP